MLMTTLLTLVTILNSHNVSITHQHQPPQPWPSSLPQPSHPSLHTSNTIKHQITLFCRFLVVKWSHRCLKILCTPCASKLKVDCRISGGCDVQPFLWSVCEWGRLPFSEGQKLQAILAPQPSASTQLAWSNLRPIDIVPGCKIHLSTSNTELLYLCPSCALLMLFVPNNFEELAEFNWEISGLTQSQWALNLQIGCKRNCTWALVRLLFFSMLLILQYNNCLSTKNKQMQHKATTQFDCAFQARELSCLDVILLPSSSPPTKCHMCFYRLLNSTASLSIPTSEAKSTPSRPWNCQRATWTTTKADRMSTLKTVLLEWSIA